MSARSVVRAPNTKVVVVVYVCVCVFPCLCICLCIVGARFGVDLGVYAHVSAYVRAASIGISVTLNRENKSKLFYMSMFNLGEHAPYSHERIAQNAECRY